MHDCHARMVEQRRARRETGRPLGPGDLVQAHVGGDICEVVSAVSAGEWLDARAHATVWPRKGGSSAEQCALFGLPHAQKRRGRPAKEDE